MTKQCLILQRLVVSRERELIGVVCWGWLFERKGSEKGVVIYGS